MNFTIDIDTGGTFTDGFFTYGSKYKKIKVDTTPHDLTVCFKNCIQEGARAFEVSSTELLRGTSVLRYNTTVGTNALIQRTGSKIGLLVTKGAEDNLYDTKNNRVLNFLVEKEMVRGLDEEINSKGEVVKDLNKENVQQAVKNLLETGARIIVVSLRNSYHNNVHEKQIKKWIHQDFPNHYLGSNPIFIGSEFSHSRIDSVRTNSTVVNAYLHKDMVRYLYKAEDDIRDKGIRHPLLIGHSSGGAARVAKTRALDTFNSGPVAGMLGSQFVGNKLYKLKNVITIDVGGTSTDLGLIIDGSIPYVETPSVHGLPVDIPLLKVETIGAGGGTTSQLVDGALKVGPNSAGAVPGPACYGLGGELPTTTDAFVSIGVIDPEYFLGGTKQLDKEKADEAINNLAIKLNSNIPETAQNILNTLINQISKEIKKLIQPKGIEAEECTMFSFGGAGGLLSAKVADQLGIKKIVTFPFSSVFSAFGSSTLDIKHIYENVYTMRLNSYDEQEIQQLSAILQNMKKQALRDMRGEGFEEGEVSFQIEWKVWNQSKQEQVAINTVLPQLDDICEVKRIVSRIAAQSENGEVEGLRVKSNASVPHFEFKTYELSNLPLDIRAVKTSRDIYWNHEYVNTNIYERNLLVPGNCVLGPAVVESNDSTYLVPTDWSYRIDEFNNGILEKQ
ncbi:hypothetical protein CVD28_23405 [Bacillus sp. M6-12]|uniref:hydantoinase/oxoprolinase family protein n=1 Tax=Bacillus sp. M6-12 TaxID=2054166 RepID=UPI000C79470C|nr:hydantoinase/oxoprolinase family protein [Bacillus sp. M6-12]PLS15277.1 hypothetical protein CVD28_23405 [Bacillus sp. M6-12]